MSVGVETRRVPDAEELRRSVADRFATWADTEARDLPLPGAGRTRDRFAALYALGRTDLSLARLAEGHADATAILCELGEAPPGPGERWGVWAAQPPGTGLQARQDGDGWLLEGHKAYCSGAHSCTHGLVTADTEEGRRLFAVRTDHPGYAPLEGTWQAIGMAGSDTPDVRFTDVPARPVGKAGAYLDRPGFQHGGIGVAACWLGGARAVADTLQTGARTEDPLTAAHLGAVDVALYAAETALWEAARAIDADPLDRSGAARLRSLRVRAIAERACSDVLDRVGRATGAGPLCHDPRHARNAVDLTVYIRQHHAERNLAELGALVGQKASSEAGTEARSEAGPKR
ncbi:MULTISPECIES: acyl-CoA dehydrogenase family protein [Streptomyces]|uniref:acyl-CoA dehydrogenase family protein n=1 Tax=Streptomyces TaxID=1883 RepID=UPI0004CCDC36|nr:MULTISPECIES: acyl-CoA dehydrogenase family protein [Streptomyces]KOT49956.1 acyl-CoA dehydrogenase [Streptomyces rimosus subsp. rimosus]